MACRLSIPDSRLLKPTRPNPQHMDRRIRDVRSGGVSPPIDEQQGNKHRHHATAPSHGHISSSLVLLQLQMSLKGRSSLFCFLFERNLYLVWCYYSRLERNVDVSFQLVSFVYDLVLWSEIDITLLNHANVGRLY